MCVVVGKCACRPVRRGRVVGLGTSVLLILPLCISIAGLLLGWVSEGNLFCSIIAPVVVIVAVRGCGLIRP